MVVHGVPDGTNDITTVGGHCADVTQSVTGTPIFSFASTTDPSPGDAKGDRMLGFVQQSDTGDAFGPAVRTTSPSTNTILTTRVDFPDGSGSGMAMVWYYADGENSTDTLYVGTWPLGTTPAQGWSTVNASSVTYTWEALDQTGGIWSPAGTGTLVDFTTANSGSAPVAYLGLVFGCNGEKLLLRRLPLRVHRQ